MNSRHLVLKTVLAAFLLLVAIECRPDESANSEKSATDPVSRKTAGQVRDDNGLRMKLVWCPGGFVTLTNMEVVDFVEGESDEDDLNNLPFPNPSGKGLQIKKFTPVKVWLTHGYWLGKYEVTQSEWKQVIPTEPWQGKEGTKDGDDIPVTFVNWQGATEFCSRLTELEHEAGRLPEGWEYTLPTDAQWERAGRARTETAYSFGDDESKLGEYAWYRENSLNVGEKNAFPVGQKKPNPWGLHDMHGNVWEWCRDWHVYGKLPGGRDPEMTEMEMKMPRKVIRGGCGGNAASNCRSGESRNPAKLSSRSCCLGFRVALSMSLKK
jgi:formylglycine-generating enzyme required for sulfatase activity